MVVSSDKVRALAVNVVSQSCAARLRPALAQLLHSAISQHFTFLANTSLSKYATPLRLPELPADRGLLLSLLEPSPVPESLSSP